MRGSVALLVRDGLVVDLARRPIAEALQLQLGVPLSEHLIDRRIVRACRRVAATKRPVAYSVDGRTLWIVPTKAGGVGLHLAHAPTRQRALRAGTSHDGALSAG